MIDAKIVKENPNLVKEMLIKRNIDFPVEDLIEADKKRRSLIIELQDTYHKKNEIAKEIGSKKKNKQEIVDEINEMEQIGKKITALEEENKRTEELFKKLIRNIPNFFHESVPIGKDENDNKVIRFFKNDMLFKKSEILVQKGIKLDAKISGSHTDFQAKNHIDIARELDLVDLERAGKISGARFFFLKNDLVRLGMALSSFATDYLMEQGYSIVQPPYMIKKEAMEGAVILSDFEETIYKIENEDLYMIGTSEHPIASMYMNEIIDGKKLPLKYAGISPCFRKEAGAHGKDMKGIFRVHQFEKVEQFIFCKPEESWNEHERLLKTTEKFYEMLEIPFRTIVLCSGDLGKISAKTFDIEAWFPAQNAYREICSCSNCTDYQARGLKIRFRDNPNEDTSLVHTLNSTLVAIQRTIVAIIENYQTKNGTIEIPSVLREYMNDKKEIA